MPHFVVREFHGVENYAVEFFYSPLDSAGRRKFPTPKRTYEIPEYLATLPLDVLIHIYKTGEYPSRHEKIPTLLKNLAIARITQDRKPKLIP